VGKRETVLGGTKRVGELEVHPWGESYLLIRAELFPRFNNCHIHISVVVTNISPERFNIHRTVWNINEEK